MSALPVIRGTSAALYPYDLTISFETAVNVFENGGQQRWARRSPIAKLALHYNKFTRTQRNTVDAFFDASQGQASKTLSVTIGTLVFNNLAFDSDSFASQESKPTQYGMTLNLTQTLSGGTFFQYPAGDVFPLLSNGAMSQLPFTRGIRHSTIIQRMPAGPVYSYAQYGAGLANFPTHGLRFWKFDEPALLDIDVAIRVNHFIANYGRAVGFPFVDEDGTTFAAVHYAQDDLVINYRGPDTSSMSLSLEQPYGG